MFRSFQPLLLLKSLRHDTLKLFLKGNYFMVELRTVISSFQACIKMVKSIYVLKYCKGVIK